MRYQAFLLAALLLAVTVSSAGAHALLDHALPEVGSTVTNSPDEIEIWFTNFLKPGHCTIQVQDVRGEEVDKKDSHCDAKDKFLLHVSVPKLSAGTYTVIWRATADDGHVTHGQFKFTIQPRTETQLNQNHVSCAPQQPTNLGQGRFFKTSSTFSLNGELLPCYSCGC
jgi:copper resistance protein C